MRTAWTWTSLPAFESDDGGVADARVADEDLLDVVGVHLRAVRHDEHVLLAALEGEEAIRVQLAVVAGAIPAVLEHRRRRVRPLPVALEHVRAADQDLAIGREPTSTPGITSPTVPMRLSSTRVKATTGEVSVAP